MGELNEQLVDMMKMSGLASNPEESIDREVYKETSKSFFEAVEQMCLTEKDFRVCLYVYPNIIMLRLFKSFKSQPRLAIVTATLARASTDLVHFFIVFFCVYMC